jgi:hypothetical protein
MNPESFGAVSFMEFFVGIIAITIEAEDVEKTMFLGL